MSEYRLKASIAVSHLSSFVLKQIFRKPGETLPGRILLSLSPSAIEALSFKKKIALVSGTNGKTSTTKALAQSVSLLGNVTSNSTGSNLSWGAVSTLMKSSDYAILEIDELHLVQVMNETKPKVVLLLNLTRDQLHRMHEVKRVADRWYAVCSRNSETTFVIDVDDPFVAYAVKDSAKVIRVSFGGRRHPDASVCPSCGRYMNWQGGIYDCACDLTNKNADQVFPAGSAAYRNATLANIAAGVLGAPPIPIDEKALERTVTKEINGVTAEIRLTKNPASWTEALSGVKNHEVILILNARQVDGIDTSWLWDVSFEGLKGKKVIVCGERALDMAYRLHVEGIESQVVENFDAVTKLIPKGHTVNVLAAYTAFFGLVSK